MKRFIAPILISLTAMLYMGCEEMVTNVNLPDEDPKLVVSAFLSPDDTKIEVIVTQTSLLFDTIEYGFDDYDWVEDADVFISNGSTTKQLSYNPSQHSYFLPVAEMPMLIGNSYTVKVKTPDKREAEGTCTIPTMTSHNLRLESISPLSNELPEIKIIKLKFDDPASIKNYYRILGTAVWEKPGSPLDTMVDGIYMDGRSEFISDVNFDGASNILSFQASNLRAGGYELKSLQIHFLTTDAAYYHFHRALEDNSNNSGNPFAEPVIMYTNIKGGRGVVSAYNREVVNIAIP